MSALLDHYASQHMLNFLSREPYKELVPMRSPPGYPLGYVRERVTITCKCGNVTTYSRLLVVERSSTKSRGIRPCGMSETIYDLEVAEVEPKGGTPVCDACWPGEREYVPALPDPKLKIGHSRPAELVLDVDDFKDLTL